MYFISRLVFLSDPFKEYTMGLSYFYGPVITSCDAIFQFKIPDGTHMKYNWLQLNVPVEYICKSKIVNQIIARHCILYISPLDNHNGLRFYLWFVF